MAGGWAESPLGYRLRGPWKQLLQAVLLGWCCTVWWGWGVGSGGPKTQHEHTPLELGDATTLDKRVSSPRRKGKFWASCFLAESLLPHLENGYHLYGLQKTPGAVPGSGA